MLVITGPVGVGKTTVAASLSELLSQARLPHAFIDLDWLRWCHPSPADDPFQLELGIQNLTAIWSHYQAVGAVRLILVDDREARHARHLPEHHIPAEWPRPSSTVHFMTDGIESAVSQAKDAAGKSVGVQYNINPNIVMDMCCYN